MALPKFATVHAGFHTELKRRINDYFDQTGKAPTGDIRLYFKAVVLTVSFVAVYVNLVFFTPATWIALAECIVLGGLTAAIGFNVMHDGAHGSFSKHPFVNKMAGLSLNFLGANVFLWMTKHNVIHHAYTNVDGIDDDIEARPFLRLCESQKYYKMHRYQHIYVWFAYSILYLYWIFFTDYRKYFTGKIGDVPLKKMNFKEHFSFWFFKATHLVIFAGIPIYVVGFSTWLVGFWVLVSFAGLVLSIVFQLAHTLSETSFPEPTNGKMPDEWAIHQLKTTANFATGNKVISWLVGGLNYQIEHHLFPKISHVHYPEISKIIRNACAEYGIQYIEHPKMRVALVSHVNHLRKLGRP
jgi:linoleoyl-CoA desaturase